MLIGGWTRTVMIMETIKPTVSEAVHQLMAMTDETVSAAAIAPIVKMHPSVIIDYARKGQWNLCKYVISGRNVKFFRTDFLKNCGFEDEAETKKIDVMGLILQELKAIREALQGLHEKQNPATDATGDRAERG
jgi:hypothetical protein